MKISTTTGMKASQFLAAISLAIFTLPSTSFAQSVALDEIVVTATKREESLQDVPVSVAVMSGDKIAEQGAFSLEDVIQFVPNVFITELSGNEAIIIRGLGSQGNAGFEQSVGTFVDGVYRGRGQASRAALVDIERVEILRGAQNTLLGKNTIAGAITVTSANPTDEFEGSVMATAEPEFGGWGAQAVLSGPLSDTFSARFAIRRDETDGYFTNQTTGRDERAEEETVWRLGLNWEASDNVDVLFKWEHGEQDTIGRQNKVGIASPTATFIYQTFGDPNFAAGMNFDKYQDGALPGRPQQFDNSEWDLMSLNISWDIGDYNLRSITGYIDAFAYNSLDLDFAPIQFIGQQRQETHEQFSQEFILTSPEYGSFSFLAGLYYQDEELSRRGDLDFFFTTLAPLFAGNPAEPLVLAGFGDATIVRRNDQNAETLSVFGQATFEISEKARLIAGLRYSEDEKDLNKSLVIAAFDQVDYDIYNEPASLPHTAFYDQLFSFAKQHTFDSNGFETCDTTIIPAISQTCSTAPGFDNVRSEDHWTGDIIFEYDFSDDAMFYARYGSGYKAGGYDEANLIGNPAAQEFEDENVDSIEIGTKIGFWDGRARVNIAAFHSDFENLQVSIFDGTAGFQVGNAAEAVSEGVEIDGQFQFSEAWSMDVGLAFLNAEYESFPEGPCHVGIAAPFCDLSGQKTQYASDFSGNAALNYTTPISTSLYFDFGLDVQHRSEYFVTGDNDPVIQQPAFTKWNARIGISSDRWSVALLGKNLSDEYIVNGPDDIPLGGFGFAGSYFFMADPPRSYELQARFNF